MLISDIIWIEIEIETVFLLYRFVEEYRILSLQECWILVLEPVRVSGEEIDVFSIKFWLLILLLNLCNIL